MLRTSPHTEILIRIYFGLLAVAIVLSSVLVNRHLHDHFAKPQATAEAVTVPPTREAPAVPPPRGPGPGINWGGKKL